MPVTLHFAFYGDVQVDRTLAGIADRAEDARPAWEQMADNFERMEQRQFASQGASAGSSWAPLSPPYAAWKAQHYPGKPILRRTDDLWRSLTRRPFGVEVIEPRSMIIGSDVSYGAYHQRGSGRLPRRPPVLMTEDMRRRWVRIMQRFLVTGEAAA